MINIYRTSSTCRQVERLLRHIRPYITSASVDTNSVNLIRNTGIIAHVDAGKTTATERMLYYAGAINMIGDVDRGTTVTDYLKQERERGITITSAAVTLEWKNHRINLIDTPGHVDFTFEVERSLRVLDGAVAVFDATVGVEAQSVTVWRQASHYGIPRIAFMNKMDRDSANFSNAVESVRNKLQTVPLPIQYPLGVGKQFTGVCDLVTMEVIKWNELDGSYDCEAIDACLSLSQDLVSEVKQTRCKLVEEVAMHSNEALAKMFASPDNTLSPDELLYFIRKLTHSCSVVPVLCGSALKNKGIQPLMDAMLYFLPSPAHKPFNQLPTVVQKLCAFVFKVVYSHQRGPVVFVRVYSGSLRPHSNIYNMSRKCKERVNKLLLVFADELREVTEMTHGNIAALVGLKNTYTGDVLVASAEVASAAEKELKDGAMANSESLLKGLEAPEPVFFRTIEPYSAVEQQDLEHALKGLSSEDPSLRVSTDPDSHQMILSGMGELHLDIVCDRIRRDFNVSVTLGAIQVSYREAPSKSVTRSGSIDRTVGHQRHLISIRITVAPVKDGGPIREVEYAKTISMDEQVSEAVTQGILQACSRGPLLSFPVINAKITVEQISYAQGSSPVIAQNCAVECMAKVLAGSDLMLLEPVMTAEVVVPEEYLGTVLGDLSLRRAAIGKVLPREDMKLIIADVPLACLMDYSTMIRTITSGLGSHSLHFSHYSPLNDKLTEAVIIKTRGF